jgi:hypothetical protein
MVRLYVFAAVFAAGLAVGGGSIWKVQNWRHAANERDRLAAEAQVQRDQSKRIDRAAESYLTAKAAADSKANIIEREVIRYVQNPAHAAECIDADGLRILADIAAAENARRSPATAVRGPDSAD